MEVMVSVIVGSVSVKAAGLDNTATAHQVSTPASLRLEPCVVGEVDVNVAGASVTAQVFLEIPVKSAQLVATPAALKGPVLNAICFQKSSNLGYVQRHVT